MKSFAYLPLVLLSFWHLNRFYGDIIWMHVVSEWYIIMFANVKAIISLYV